jgi:hypothetical protein
VFLLFYSQILISFKFIVDPDAVGSTAPVVAVRVGENKKALRNPQRISKGA